jgi:hypothetical protein
MRTYFYLPVCFVILLVVCLMFAPARRVTGDLELSGRPAELPVGQPAESAKTFGDLCRDNPVEAIAASLCRYKSDVEGYTCKLAKQERIKGELRDPELIACDFSEAPFAVIMRWLEGKGRVDALLYAAGENGDQLLLIPSSDTLKAALRVMGKTYGKRGLTSEDARSASRYPADQFGIYHATQRVYAAWRAAQERGTLKTRYDGVRSIRELDSRPCHVLHRMCVTPEEDGLTQVTLMFDAETLLQIGAEIRGGNELIATYYFRDLKLNPRFDAKHFAAERFK